MKIEGWNNWVVEGLLFGVLLLREDMLNTYIHLVNNKTSKYIKSIC